MKHRIFAALFAILFLSAHSMAQLPRSNHVVLLIEENHSFESVVGSSSMPYLNSLMAKYGLATRYYANVHPSIGNYFMMTTGQVISTTDGWPGTVTSNNLARQLIKGGKSWKVYAEGLPSVGYVGGDTYPYVKHHNPFAYFSDVKSSSKERDNIVPSTDLANDLTNDHLPNLSLIIPDELHDAHSASLSAADSWLKQKIAPLLSNHSFQQDGILIITFDESTDSDKIHGGGRVATVVIGPKVLPHKQSSTFYQHQSILRSIEHALGLPTMAAASSCNSFSDFF